MSSSKLKESASDELTHAASILEMIINGNVTPNTHMFNAIESVIGNINRAKGKISNIITEKEEWIADTKITTDESLESAVGSVLSILNIAIKLKISEDSGELKNQYNPIIDLILSAKINMEIIYQKVSTQ